ncbi:hypothetical protein J169_03711 [Xanthomonas citri pv. citri]|nr:hypothetical protein J151_03714 [Xanthomonas citri subsp. citri A306]AJY92500.1 hypothetical protein J169_03711 [Xanthomonas citri pv. citri]AJZ10240.1 hypothetical protein J172_03704 [Xanthomonas citri pv. citri]AJZ32408.1 hypothetical protein J171_03706 [Xanthomonas citri pv. citri]AJZ36872.1 hypothetical protein J170_03705 [Xanthomonas citri pv. citri]
MSPPIWATGSVPNARWGYASTPHAKTSTAMSIMPTATAISCRWPATGRSPRRRCCSWTWNISTGNSARCQAINCWAARRYRAISMCTACSATSRGRGQWKWIRSTRSCVTPTSSTTTGAPLPKHRAVVRRSTISPHSPGAVMARQAAPTSPPRTSSARRASTTSTITVAPTTPACTISCVPRSKAMSRPARWSIT